jgi:uncharacterized protein YqfA (UPF0365 family)
MPVSALQRLTLWFRKVPVGPIERSLRIVERERLPIAIAALEAHLLSGGDPERVVDAMVATNRRTAHDFAELTAADLVGRLPESDV